MPQPAMHLLFAQQALDRWERRPDHSPFTAAEPVLRNAFLHGSLGPDMGLFPGADPLASWHIHRGGGSDVARRLVAADDAVLRAYGWGWVTHVIADARIHPLVNEGAAALLRERAIDRAGEPARGSHDARAGNRDHAGGHDPASTYGQRRGPRRAPGRSERLVAHIRVELGIEGWFAGLAPGTRNTRLRHVFHRASIEPLVDILRATYGVDFETGPILAAHRGVAPFAAACLTLARLLAADLQRRHTVAETVAGDERDFLRLPGVRRVASAMVAAASPAQGFLNPVRPAPWLVDRARAECDAGMTELDGYAEHGLDALPDYDLNTGTRLDGAAGAWVA